jgi:long-chain acyl-CoA synthetase
MASMTPNNLSVLHRFQAERLGPRPALRYRRNGMYRDISWDAYRDRACAVAAALIDSGVRPGDRVGLLGENSVDWLVADMGLLAAGAVNVPPHAPLTARQVQYQLSDSGASWLFVSTEEQLEKYRAMRSELPAIRGVVGFQVYGDDVEPWEAFIQRGRRALPRLAAEVRRREEHVGPDDLATVMYTSGTTGVPKGVMLSHGNIISNSLSSLEAAPRLPEAVVLSWLPFTHIYARTVDHYGAIASGAPLCLADSQDTLVENIAEIQPTNMSSVPRFYEKILTAVACPDKAEMGKRLRRIFGGRFDWLGSGGAPLPYPVAKAYQEAGLLVLQGYGLTESSPVISFNSKEHYKLDTVGRPIPGIEVKIGPDGEVLTKGPHVMKGYWKSPEATADAIQNGWLHTGDLGEIDRDGFLKITGRKKELLVLSNGKKVVPSYLEGLLCSDPCIDQAVICGEGRNYLTALLVPHWDNIARELKATGVTLVADDEGRARQREVVDLLDGRVKRALADVSNAEQVKRFAVLPRPFTVANDEITVSLKLRRGVVLNHYADRLGELYCE